MITIKLNEIILSAKHGVYEEEHFSPQRFKINVALELDTDKASQSRNLSDTVDWAGLRKEILHIFDSENMVLAETIAATIAELCITKKHVRQATVEVAKLDIWGGGDNGYPSVVLTKAR